MSKVQLRNAEFVHQRDLVAASPLQRIDVVLHRLFREASRSQHIADGLQLRRACTAGSGRCGWIGQPFGSLMTDIAHTSERGALLTHRRDQQLSARRALIRPERRGKTGETTIGLMGGPHEMVTYHPLPLKSLSIATYAQGFGRGHLPQDWLRRSNQPDYVPGCTIIAIRGKLKLPPASSITFTWHTYVPGFSCVSGTSN